MTTLVRRMAPVAALAAALCVLAVPGTALAKGKVKTDQLGQCEGANIEGLGSSFQAPAEFLWTGKSFPTEDGFNVSKSKLACSGAKRPTVVYNQEEAQKGSGACLKDFGAGGATPKLTTFPGPCGTDEAPSETAKIEYEGKAEGAPEKGEGIQTIPVLQGSLAVIVHLPEGCKATSEPDLNKKTTKIGRLSLERSVVEGIYDGSIKTWKAAIAANKSASDTLTCTEPKEEEDTITPVVRLDKSGTTHIFKAFLKQVNTAEFQMEEFTEINEKSAGHEHVLPCKVVLPAEKKTWAQVAEGCENQRWPEAAHIVRGEVTGNPGVVGTVAKTPSSIGYADMAVAREKGYFSKKGTGGSCVATTEVCGGENTAGEQNVRFWTPLQISKATSKKAEYADPATNGDVEALGNSNCSKTVYALKAGEKFPPKTTRLDWSKVIGLDESKTYSICGLTYVIAPRLYYPFLHAENPAITQEQSQKIATTVSNYIKWVLQQKEGGGGEEIKGHDYEPIPKKALKIAELGAAEIGSKEA
jgi:ABC-type phosphate transport system substrate-binding protein